MRFYALRYDRFYRFCTDFSKSVSRYFGTIALYRNYDDFSFAYFREYHKLKNFLTHIWVINFCDCFVNNKMFWRGGSQTSEMLDLNTCLNLAVRLDLTTWLDLLTRKGSFNVCVIILFTVDSFLKALAIISISSNWIILRSF